MHGRGWYREPGARLYSGEMVDGQFSGMGWLRTKSGYIEYQGSFVAGNRSGPGLLTLQVGKVYSNFVNDRPHELGWAVDSLDNVYAGQYSDGQRNGFGVMEFHGLATYYGEWKNGKRIGCGYLERGDAIEAQLYTMLFGKVREGTWVYCNRTTDCRTGIYCRCDEDDVRLLQQKPETYRQCVDDAKAKAIQYKKMAIELKESIAKDLEAMEWPGKDADFGNVTDPEMLKWREESATKVEKKRRSSKGFLDDEEDDEDDDIGAAMMADLVAFTSLLSLFQFLRKMFEDEPLKVRVIWALFGMGCVLLYEKSVGWQVTFEALYVTYKVFTDNYDEEVEGRINAHGEL